MLDRADLLLRQLLDTLAPALSRGVAVIGLEPACVAAFRDEVPALFPHDERAKQLQRQSFLLSEFCGHNWPAALDEPRANGGGTALVQIHCHQHAVLDPEAERRVLERLGIKGEVLPSGCCGMAGSFGFEAEKYRWSRKIAETGLLPRLAAAPPDAPVLANGFSCREQIEQLSGRRTRHIAEVLAEALGFAPPAESRAAASGNGWLALGGVLAAGALLGAAAAYRSRGGAAAARGAHSIAATNPATPSAPANSSPR